MTADEFRNWRLDLGWTQADAATQLGISISAVADYEKGMKRGTDRSAPVPRAIAIACRYLAHHYRKMNAEN